MCLKPPLICVIGIANGSVGLVVFYEQEVKDRVVTLGLTTRDRIKKTSVITMIALFVPMLLLVPYMVYGINGASGFRQGFCQMLVILMIEGLFDRIFIDWWWVGHTKAWIIPGTEDPMPVRTRKNAAEEMGRHTGRVSSPAAVLAGLCRCFEEMNRIYNINI